MRYTFIKKNPTNKSIKIKKREENQKYLLKKEFNFEKSFSLSSISKISQKDEIINQNQNNIYNDVEQNSSLHSLFESKNINLKKSPKIKIKLKKEDLDNIPLPLFSCIYCSNDYLSFKHLSYEIISNKYLFQTSIYDLKELELVITNNELTNKVNKNSRLINFILNTSEYLYSFYNMKEIKTFFKLNIFKVICYQNSCLIKKNLIRKNQYLYLRDNKKFWNNNKLLTSKNKINNQYLINSKNDEWKLNKNYCILNSLITKNNISLNRYNSSFFNLKSTIYSKYKINFLLKSKNYDNNNNVQNKKKNNFILCKSDKTQTPKIKILEDFSNENNNLKRKINKKDIEWEKEYYDIYNPIIKDDSLFNNEENKQIKNKNITYNCNEKNKKNYLKEQKYIHSENNIFIKKLRILNLNKSFKLKNKNSLSFYANNNNILKKQKLSSINKINTETNIKRNNLTPIQSSKISNKYEKKKYECNKTPIYSKTKLKDLYCKSGKKLIKQGSKKILFNYQMNIKENFLDKSLNRKIDIGINNTNKKNNINIKKKFINLDISNFELYKKENNIFNIYNNIINSSKKKKFNLKLTKDHYNFSNILFNKNLYNKSEYDLKTNKNEIKCNNLNIFFNIKNIFTNSPIKNKIQNSIYKNISLLSNNKK